MPPLSPSLPQPTADALAHSHRLCEWIFDLIDAHGGFLSFERYMHEVLHAPGLGYYSAGATKLGREGDFVTASELSPRFGQALASQIAQISRASAPRVLELGAGSGKLARDILLACAALGMPLTEYAILEVSADLRERQRALLLRDAPEFLERVRWLDVLPEDWQGTVLANEVLDAIACHVLEKTEGGWLECGVARDGDTLRWATRMATPALFALADERTAEVGTLPTGYRLEINPAAEALVGQIARILTCGAALLIDYGFPARELYHPQRTEGSLIAHYRHRAHDDVLRWPGLQDITAHIDFTAMAHAADDADATLYGYTSQAHFLLNCGLLQLLPQHPETPADFTAIHAAQRLLSEAEMGELFKVLAFGRGLHETLLGFSERDRLHRL